MTRSARSKSLLAPLAFATLLLPLPGCRDEGAAAGAQVEAAHESAHATPPAEEPAAPQNAVQREMQMLVAALQGTVAAIGDNDLARIPHLIHGTHGAKDATEAALEGGAYRLPKNADQVATFKGMDDAFHDELVVLVRHARANDLGATSTQVGRILGQCQGCHALFREMPPPLSAQGAAEPTEAAHEH